MKTLITAKAPLTTLSTARDAGLKVRTALKAGGLVVGTLAKQALPDLDAGGNARG